MRPTRTRNQKWTTEEISFIRTNSTLGAEHLATHFSSTTRAIRNLASREGISLVPELSYTYEFDCPDCGKHMSLIRLNRKAPQSKCDGCRNRAWRERTGKKPIVSPEQKMLHAAKTRAKKKGVPFSLTVDDIVIATHCPVLGIELQPAQGVGAHMAGDCSPTLDRIVPELGYVPGNVAVISWRANKLKGDGTLDELRKVAAWLQNNS